ncbi:MAG: hypothetical protein ACRCZR_01345 [Cetobacterium sp.]
MMKFTKKGLLELMGTAGVTVGLTKECRDILTKESNDYILDITKRVEEFNESKTFNESMGRIEQIEMNIDYEKCTIKFSNGEFVNMPKMRALKNYDKGYVATVKSKEVVINEVHFLIKDLIVLSENTFTTENGMKYNMIWQLNKPGDKAEVETVEKGPTYIEDRDYVIVDNEDKFNVIYEASGTICMGGFDTVDIARKFIEDQYLPKVKVSKSKNTRQLAIFKDNLEIVEINNVECITSDNKIVPINDDDLLIIENSKNVKHLNNIRKITITYGDNMIKNENSYSNTFTYLITSKINQMKLIENIARKLDKENLFPLGCHRKIQARDIDSNNLGSWDLDGKEYYVNTINELIDDIKSKM